MVVRQPTMLVDRIAQHRVEAREQGFHGPGTELHGDVLPTDDTQALHARPDGSPGELHEALVGYGEQLTHRHGVHGPQEAEVLGREGVRRKAHRVGDSGHDKQVIAEAFALAAVAFDGRVVGLEGHGEEAVDVPGCLAGELDARRGDVCSAVAPHEVTLRPPQGDPGHAVALVLVGHLRRGAEEAEPRAGRVDRVGAGDELPAEVGARVDAPQGEGACGHPIWRTAPHRTEQAFPRCHTIVSLSAICIRSSAQLLFPLGI